MAEHVMKAITIASCLLVILIGVCAKDSCPTVSVPCHCIPGLPGKNGRDGQPGRDGAPGPPGELSFAEFQQLRREVVDELQIEFGTLTPSACVIVQPSTIPPEPTSTSAESYEPFTTTAQTTTGSGSLLQNEQSTIVFLQPTPNVDPEPDCNEGYNYGMSASTPAASCKQIYQCNPVAISGNYWINTTTNPMEVFCEMNATHCGNITGGWMRAVYLYDGQNCPFYTTYAGSITGCTSVITTPGCKSVVYPTHSLPYSKVCGRANAYQFGLPDAFRSYHFKNQTLDGYYVDGLSITHGTPRNHIWTFAAGQGKYSSVTDSTCPCAINAGPAAPPFVGENYFCESGFTSGSSSDSIGRDDPLFDSQGCPSSSTCCTRGGPWFSTTLQYQADDDIELRWCFDEIFHSPALEEVIVQLLEINVQ